MPKKQPKTYIILSKLNINLIFHLHPEMIKSRNPVLLVHGFTDTTAVFHQMTTYLTNLGWSVYSFNLTPNTGACRLENLAHQVAAYINNTFSQTQPVDLIGFSMGGLVTRYYLQRLGGIQRVQRYISISAPNQGTVTAYSLPLHGIAQMRPNSCFLQDLNRDATEQLAQINFTFIWTPFDLMIYPAANSRMPVGEEVIIPVLMHAWMLTDNRSLAAVATALKAPLKSDRPSDYRPKSDRQSQLTPDPQK